MVNYSDKPTILINLTEDGVVSVETYGYSGPDLRVITRDWTIGSQPDEHGDLYVDEEVQ